MNQVFKFKWDSGEACRQNDEDSCQKGNGGAGLLEHQAAVGYNGEECVDHDRAHTAELVKPSGIRPPAGLFNEHGHQDARKEKAGEFDHVDHNIILAVKHQVCNEVEGNLLCNFAEHEENISQKQHQQGSVLKQQGKAFFHRRDVLSVLCALSGIAEGQAGQENNPNRRDGGACQICLRRMVVKVREPCRSGDKHLRERSHDRADNGADAKELRALNTARRNRECQRSHGNIEGRISNIKTYKQNSRVNDVEDQRGIGTADKEQDHHKRHKPRGPFDIGTHLAVLRAGAIHQNPHDRIVDRVKDPAEKADV